MIHEKWIISDTHFYHENILKFLQNGKLLREFNSMEDMHETIIKNWNDRVNPRDYVYHLGDVTFRYGKVFNELFHSLNGQKRLIVGNHDDIPTLSESKLFAKIELWKGVCEKINPHFTMSHIPQRLDSIRWGEFNVHGHTHANILDDPHYINLCVETRNYSPTHFDTIFEEIKQRSS